jgi:pimeloyl-ACP methyl ester carboxylesterase
MEALMTPSPTDVEGFVAHQVATGRVFAGKGYPLDEEARAALARRCFERAFDPAGVARQMAAISASGDRTPSLRQLELPALVIHGDADPLIQEPCGRATADAIPGARYELVPGMGHDLPEALLAPLAEIIGAFTAKA